MSADEKDLLSVIPENLHEKLYTELQEKFKKPDPNKPTDPTKLSQMMEDYLNEKNKNKQ